MTEPNELPGKLFVNLRDPSKPAKSKPVARWYIRALEDEAETEGWRISMRDDAMNDIVGTITNGTGYADALAFLLGVWYERSEKDKATFDEANAKCEQVTAMYGNRSPPGMRPGHFQRMATQLANKYEFHKRKFTEQNARYWADLKELGWPTDQVTWVGYAWEES